ncbi:MAG: YifB family Mg chelatase-like AAA ATPase [Candidatus Omnitrophica bacterium]|nr:YifB family Mg chelatase-like AAA ATPase [Candidatus Omnitrophota bacterium]
MLSKINSFGILGIEAYPVEIEVDITSGLPVTNIVGLPDTSVKESKERIKSAIKNSGFRFPPQRITVNLAPADIKKEGGNFDLAIALGILASSGQINKDLLENYIVLGELSLEGKLRPIKGALPIAMKMRSDKIKNLLLPSKNAKEAALIKGIKAFGTESVKETVNFLSGRESIPATKIDMDNILSKVQRYELDFCDVKGQLMVKRALEVAVAGGHNILMIGPPGSGKSMLAKRIPTILPDMTEEEIIETTCIHSSQGLVPEKTGLIFARPFRAPHHTISDVALTGGGSNPQPGEISLAHNGVLFLDELPEFHRNVLEALRQPLEDGKVHIARAKKSLSFPSRFMLVCAMNPCPCGYFTDPKRNCRCNSTKIERYLSKISGPLLDRIDLHIEVPSLRYKEIINSQQSESSSEIKERVKKAHRIQKQRFGNENIYPIRKLISNGVYFNSHMNHKHIKKYCSLSEETKELLKAAMESMNLSARAYDKILKIARTIADLEKSDTILPSHISEAIQYRSLDRQLWI